MSGNRNIKAIGDAALQLILRMVPIFPANEFWGLIEALRKSNSDIDRQVDEAIASLKRSSETVRLLERDLTERTERLQKLRTEHANLTELTKISQQQARALADLLQQTIGRGNKKERVIALFINLLAGIIIFILGVLVSAPVTRWIGGIFH
jgi:DNA-binding transcriptional regulator YbjK